ncbi:MAG TPA: calcium-binding protein [Aquabacterium sp.]|uniref:calcium-binding protein n=1 Tax=Aquabacterium sp. TaxID=1872578 RepID=UPI002E340DA9|nr:calcium-binding protein [Aquabacterium sp.]HEX5356676.1 calcium-binding protein [Aquabacterium sp.]
MADSNIITGSPFDDFINGSDGPDHIEGGAGRDTLVGGQGEDTLAGNTGKDMLDGGSGADTYLFGRGDGQDTVFVYGPDALGDRLALSGGIQASDVDLLADGADLIVKLRDSQDSVRLAGYYEQPWADRPQIVFADGGVWDALVVDFKTQDWGFDQFGSDADDRLEGGLGDDVLFGEGGRDTLYGDAGQDLMDGGAGADTYLFGRGDGQDTVVAGWPDGPGQSDRVLLGTGIDMSSVSVVAEGPDLLLRLDGRSDSLRIANYFNFYGQDRARIEFADGSYWDGAAIDRKLQVNGDFLQGTLQNDALDGGAGDDVIVGLDGRDTLYGDTGRDMLDGGFGADTYLFGLGDGQDTVVAAPGGGEMGLPDVLQLGQGISMADVDLVQQGGDLSLNIRGTSDSVLISGYFSLAPFEALRIRFADGGQWDAQAVQGKLSAMDDFVDGTTDNNVLIGGAGRDTLMGEEGDDTLYGDAGPDTMDGGLGADTYLFGRGDGQDSIFIYGSDSGADRLLFSADIAVTDVEAWQDASDLVLRVRDTRDSVRLMGYFNMSPMDKPTVAFASGATWDAMVIDRKMAAWGTGLMGDQADNNLEGGGGDDYLSGNEGNDTLYGDGGRDVLEGGTGADTFLFGLGDGQDTVFAGSPSGFGQYDRLRFGSGIDMSNVSVWAEGADLVLRLDGRSDSVRLANYFYTYGSERTRIEFADGSYWDAAAIDRKLQFNGDYLQGSPQADALDGGAGDDQLLGQDGDDTLYGDAGQDLLDGGAGADTYLFGRGDGQDVIVPWSAWPGGSQVDTLQFGQGIAMADVDALQVGGDLLLTVRGSADSVRLTGYFSMSPDLATRIRFADGGVWDARAVQGKLSVSDDDLMGTPWGDVLMGGAGQDILVGSSGDDTIYGDAGADMMDGGLGADTFLFGKGDGQDRVMMYGQDASDDRVQLAADISVTDVLLAQEGGDLVLRVRDTRDSLRLTDYFNMSPMVRPEITFASGAVWDALVIDRKINNGGFSAWGNRADENLEGGGGDDALFGQEGDDTLYGDAGRDFMDGGVGADTYLFGRGDGQDTVMAGWSDGIGRVDRLRLGTGIDMSNVTVTAQANDLLLSIDGSSDSVLISNYFGQYGIDRTRIDFADGSYWDGFAMDRKLQGAGDDLQGSPMDDALDGGAGDDVIQGQDGNDTLYGDAGQDFMDGGPGADTYLFGKGDGQDTIVAKPDPWFGMAHDRLLLGQGIGMADLDLSQQGADLVLQRKGSDDSVRLLSYFDAGPMSRLNIEFADGAVWDGMSVDRLLLASGVSVQSDPLNLTVVGSQGNDSLLGSNGDDRLYGDAGNDWLDGLYGADTFYFGRGDGSDSLMAASNSSADGPDTLKLGDRITAVDVDLQADGSDLLLKLTGSLDQMRLVGYFNGMPGDRAVVSFSDGRQWDDETVVRKLNPGNDMLYGQRGDDVLDGGAGDDTLLGGDGQDTLYGDSGNDQLSGEAGSDTYLFGRGDGSDTVVADPGYTPDHADVLRLGYGISMADLVASAQGADLLLQVRNTADQVRIAGYLNVPQTDRMLIQFADGFQWAGADVNRKLQSSADTLTGTNGADGLDGGLGDDALQGLDGRDYLNGDQGNDLLDGGKGADTLVGGAGNDAYVVDDLGDVIVELAPDGDDQILANVDGVIMADNVERLTMGAGSVYKAVGNGAKNYIKGNAQNNTLWGLGGNDSLSGYEGADQFYGGAGNDTLVGGTGNDSYYFSRGEGADVILESDTTAGNSDKLLMQGNISANQLWFTRSSNDLLISVIGTTDSVRVGLWYQGAVYRVETITAGGKTLSANNVQQLVNAMASMSPPPMGQTTLSASYNQKLGGVIAANWV